MPYFMGKPCKDLYENVILCQLLNTYIEQHSKNPTILILCSLSSSPQRLFQTFQISTNFSWPILSIGNLSYFFTEKMDGHEDEPCQLLTTEADNSHTTAPILSSLVQSLCRMCSTSYSSMFSCPPEFIPFHVFKISFNQLLNAVSLHQGSAST